MKPDVSVVVLDYNGAEYTVGAVKSVLKRGFVNKEEYEIVIVDNGSTPEDASRLKKEFAGEKRVKVHRIEENRGFTGGNNYGFSKASARYVILLSNDTVVDRAWGTEMLKAIKADESLAAVDPKIYGPGEDPGAFCGNEGVTPVLNCIPGVLKDPQEVFLVSGCSPLLDREKTGTPFFEPHFLYYEDMYLSMKARINGYELKKVPQARVMHYGQATVKSSGAISRYAFFYEKNRITDWMLFFEPATLVKTLPFLVAGIVATNFKALVSRDGSLWPRMKAYWWLAKNFGAIMEERRKIQAERRVGDGALFRKMTCRVVGGNGFLSRVANAMSRAYCWLVGIRTHEFY